jgi:serine protease
MPTGRRALEANAALAVAAMLLSVAACRAKPAGRAQPSSPAESKAPQLTARQAAMQKRMERKVEKAPFVPGEVIAKRRAVVGPAAAPSPPPKIRELGFTEERRTSGGEVVFRLGAQMRSTLAPAAVQDRTQEALTTLRDTGQFEYVQLNYVLQIADTTPNDTDYPQQWHYFVPGSGAGEAPGGIGLPATWDTNKGSSDVVVAVIDTGILPDHPDIAGSPNLVPGYDMISDSVRANDGDGRDPNPTDPGDGNAPGECDGDPGSEDSWHGTHVAGTIGVVNTNNGVGVAGVNWHVKVQPVRVLGKCGGTLVDIDDGIRWAAGLPVPGAPTNTTPARVINMSLGGPLPCSQSPATQSAINDAVGAGTTIVVAAGNDAADASGFLPAGCDNVVAVAASDFRGFLVTRYSNFGAAVDVMAPGGDLSRDDNHDGHPDGVLSTVKGGYEWYNGTSMAAPHVAGVAALLLASDIALIPAEVEARIKSLARPRNATECPKPCGAGLLTAPVASPGPTPSPGPLALSLSPSALSLKTGGTAILTATVTSGATPRSGETVTFTSASAPVAAVDPPTSVTDSAGRASTTVRGEAQGSTSVRAQARDASAEVPVRVPALSTLGALAAALVLLLALRRRNGRAPAER